MSETGQGLAIFDLDYTLTTRGTWGRFVWRLVRFRPHIWLPLLISAGWTQWRYKQGKIPRIAVKMAMMRWSMVGKPKTVIQAHAKAFAENEVKTGLRPGAIAALAAHRENGDHMMIASAAVDIVVAEIAKNLDIDHYVATDMAWTEEGVLSAEFASKNCYGAEKLRRIEAYLAVNPFLKQKHTFITIYSDSYSDLDSLNYADVGVAVNPDKRLRAAAISGLFRLEDWRSA